MAQKIPSQEKLEEERRRSERRAMEAAAIDEDALGDVLKAAGARRSSPEARRALRALAEREISRFASEAVMEARYRGQDEVDEACMACGASSAERRRYRRD